MGALKAVGQLELLQGGARALPGSFLLMGDTGGHGLRLRLAPLLFHVAGQNLKLRDGGGRTGADLGLDLLDDLAALIGLGVATGQGIGPLGLLKLQ